MTDIVEYARYWVRREKEERPHTIGRQEMLVRDLIDEIERLRDLTTWKPITDAQKDGHPILACRVLHGDISDVAETMWLADQGRWRGFNPPPTHFLPLPEALK